MFDNQDYVVPARDILRFMGWDRNPRYLDKSIARLHNGSYRVVRRIKGLWTDKTERPIFSALSVETDQNGARLIVFRLAPEFAALQTTLQSYGYIEIATLPQMKSRWSQATYKILMTRTWKRWMNLRIHGGSVILYKTTPEELAKSIGWIKPNVPFKASIFKREVLVRLATDFAHIRQHRISAQMNNFGDIVFEMTPIAVDWRSLKVPGGAVPTVLREYDLPELRIPETFFLRVGRHFGVPPTILSGMWLLALAEAYSGEALDKGYTRAPFRGRALLKTIDDLGPVEACWKLVLSELRNASIAYYIYDRDLIRQAIDDRNRRAIGWESTLSIDVRAEIAKAVRRKRFCLTELAKDIRGMIEDRDRVSSDHMRKWRKAEVAEEDYVEYLGEDEAIRAQISSASDLSYEACLESRLERGEDDIPVGDNYRSMMAEMERELVELPY